MVTLGKEISFEPKNTDRIKVIEIINDNLYKIFYSQTKDLPTGKSIGEIMNIQKMIDKNNEIIKQLKEDDYQLMYTKYTEDDKKYVTVWEQNGEGNVRNHLVWEVKIDGFVTETIKGVLDTSNRKPTIY